MSTKSPSFAWKRHGRYHAQVHLPPLTGEEALLLCNLMDRAIAALWRTHGRAMADVLSNLQPDATSSAEPPPPAQGPELNLDDIF